MLEDVQLDPDLHCLTKTQCFQFHPRGPAYKLPPDVELSKTTSPDDDVKASKVVDDVGGDLKRLSRRESSSGDRLKSESPHVVNASDEYKSQNGLVTLSRFELRQFASIRVNLRQPIYRTTVLTKAWVVAWTKAVISR